MKSIKKAFNSLKNFFMPKEVVLETDRLILRHWKISDAQDLYHFASDERVGPNAGWPAHKNVEESRNTIQTVFNTPHTFAIVPKKLGFPIGTIGITLGRNSNISLPSTEGEIGYWIGVPYWSNGYTTEATMEIMRYGFEDLRLKQLWCGYFEGNIRSKRVQEKCGFKFDHIKKDVYWSALNEHKTEYITKMSREEWLELQATKNEQTKTQASEGQGI